jgi:predicted GNAT family N-acyltransferase
LSRHRQRGAAERRVRTDVPQIVQAFAIPPRYRRHGFVDEADDFIEDGRATIEMRKLF